MIELYFDGGCDNIKQDYGKSGYVIKENRHTIHKQSHEITGGRITTNLAEYDGLFHGLNKLIDLKLNNECIFVYGDSQLVINQMKGKWGIRNLDMPYASLALGCRYLLSKFSNISFGWIPRIYNSEADELTHSYRIPDKNYYNRFKNHKRLTRQVEMQFARHIRSIL